MKIKHTSPSNPHPKEGEEPTPKRRNRSTNRSCLNLNQQN